MNHAFPTLIRSLCRASVSSRHRWRDGAVRGAFIPSRQRSSSARAAPSTAYQFLSSQAWGRKQPSEWRQLCRGYAHASTLPQPNKRRKPRRALRQDPPLADDVPPLIERYREAHPEAWKEIIKRTQGDPEYIAKAWEEDGAVPLPSLIAEEVKDLFGKNVDSETANDLIKILQYRRLNGSLADPQVWVHTHLNVDGATPVEALEYLRRTYPLDEQAIAAEWAEEEAKRIEAEMQGRAVSLGIYRADTKSRTIATGTAADNAADVGTATASVYGRSALDTIRERNRARWAAEEKRLEELEQKRAQEQAEKEQRDAELEAQNPGALSKREPTYRNALEPAFKIAQLTRQPSEWVQKYAEKAAITHDTTPPEMSAWRRVGPSTVFALAVIGGSWLYAEYYTPPSTQGRLFPETPPAVSTIAGILAVNLLVFLAWRFPMFWRFGNKYMFLAPGWPNAVATLGTTFSHQTVGHLSVNMLSLAIFGSMLYEYIGRGNFIALYLTAGVTGSLASLYSATFLRNFTIASLGASGAICGVQAAWCMFYDKSTIHVPLVDFDVPASTMTILVMFIAVEVWQLRTKGFSSGVDHLGHLGGYAAGIVSALFLKWKAAERQREALVADVQADTVGEVERAADARQSASN